MGRSSAVDMIEQAGGLTGAVLEWHLFSNHYPPPPRCMLRVAEEAIEFARHGDGDALIALPEGVHYAKGNAPAGFVKASDVMESFHLWGLDAWTGGEL